MTDFFQALAAAYYQETKITKGTSKHNCYLCKDWIQKRKMKLLLYAAPENLNHTHILCFKCWTGFKQWEMVNPTEKVEKVAKKSPRKVSIINRRF